MSHEYRNYDDLSRLEYSRMFWKIPRLQKKLLDHWTDPRHPYAERFRENEATIVEALESLAEYDEVLDSRLRERGSSLRAVLRMIPPVFGHFW